jgi:hypothetical protein
MFHLVDGGTINIEVDSKSEEEKFQISSLTEVFTLKSPFDEEEASGGNDTRVSIFKKVITKDPSENEKYYQYYYNINKLLCNVELKTKWHHLNC